MHVFYLIDSVGASGGAEQSLALLTPEYRRLGVHLDVGVLHDRPGYQEALRAAGAELFVVEGDSRAARQSAATRLIRQRRPDIVHTTLYEADVLGRIAARRAGVPVVSSLVSEPYGADHFSDPAISSWKLRSAWLVDAMTARLTVRMHAVSQSVAATMAKRLHYPSSRIDVVPRGRSPAELGVASAERRAAARRMLGVCHDTPIVLAVARQEHAKGLDTALRSFPAIRDVYPDARFLIAGREGAQSAELVRLVDALELGEAVRFLGSRDDVAELLCAADVFLMPSRREGSPGALIEAMALETPAVVSNILQVLEVVDETTATLVRPEDPDALARATVATLAGRDRAQQRADRARQRFLDDFSIDRIGERMVAFYRKALAVS